MIGDALINYSLIITRNRPTTCSARQRRCRRLVFVAGSSALMRHANESALPVQTWQQLSRQGHPIGLPTAPRRPESRAANPSLLKSSTGVW